ncbi:MAG: cell division FtsA domain-containing protein [Syntrophomonas sp.]|uniref:cell division protein FtsA n=1 Tax=Syntrophomonas sp. TaxID=2053627 RepID=UPI00260215AA|nr:cell division FtsA domain-containing protein [Syntrophomonas sp.]MDD2509553.1 cell division FtsA domain-containing protein [Syntrophomonas sp.]MDD3878424.1 cell division FtsA domain-containing protein [Syntrophomonas sp.]MDD4625477.1 cell division FtsA domain-containing protein [Syntrophomonas sp.]
MDGKKILALDIGTRKIMGLVMQEKSGSYEVLSSAIMEHKTRAMMDGQIHDVEEVARGIQSIKEQIEAELQIKLESAAVAAAGRALKTSLGQVVKRRPVMSEISPEEVRALEIEAVHRAQYLLGQGEGRQNIQGDYFCVGYSIISYSLEEQEIGSLVGQVGSEYGVRVIATFLPRVVVDSLFSALKKSGLEVYSLTLEPIAALSLAIPPSMRLLNLALVDIGAGTSDIAIVKNGSIYAYAMVPQGGDKLTESLAATYLLDFNHAEKIKRLLSQQSDIEIVDVLGNCSRVQSSEVLQELQPVLDQLLENISRNILELNQKAPDAVICIGGGSLIPSLASVLAEHLNLPQNRVGIKSSDSLEEITLDKNHLQGPQGVTPLGIAYYSFSRVPVPFIKVSVNGREVPVWNLGKLDVSAALLSSGINLGNIYGKPGLGKTIEVNGEVKVFKGEMGTPPLIKLNDSPAFLESTIEEGTRIEFIPGKDGKEARVMLQDLLSLSEGEVFVNGEPLHLKPLVLINGQEVKPDQAIPDRSQVVFRAVNSLANILNLAGVGEHWLQEKTYHYYINDEERSLLWVPVKVLVNGEPGQLKQEVAFGSQVSFSLSQLRPQIKDACSDLEDLRLQVKVNGQTLSLEGKGALIKLQDRVVNLEEELEDGAHLLIDKGKSSAILSDIFRFFEMETSMTGRLKMKVDGEEAGFTTPIFNSSVVEIVWEE